MAVATTASKNFAEASQKSKMLYRGFMRAVPDIIDKYTLNYTPQQIRSRIRKEWDTHGGVRDVENLDILVFMGHVELGEFALMFKTVPHVLHYMEPPETKKRTTIKKPASNFEAMKERPVLK